MRDRSDRAPEARATLDKFRGLVARGVTYRQAEAELHVPRSTLWRVAQRRALPARRRRVSREIERRLRRELARATMDSLRQIAARVGCSKDTVARRKRARAERLAGDSPRPTTKAWRCPGCGRKLNVDRCLACQLARAG